MVENFPISTTTTSWYYAKNAHATIYGTPYKPILFQQQKQINSNGNEL